jgi:Sphingosine kinase and enzymes related to eukaryotic diacylglycerol kinase
MSAFKKCTILYNSLSGKKTFSIYRDTIVKMVSEKTGEMPECFDVISIGKNNLPSFMEANPAPFYLSIGGDGTFKEVVSSALTLAETPTIAHLPLGSVNDVGNNFFLGKKTLINLDQILDGEPYKLDICSINGETFNYFAGLGTIQASAYGTSQSLKNKLGFPALVMHITKETFFPGTEFYNITYEVNGIIKTVKTPFVFVGNTRNYAGFHKLIPTAKFDDKLFEVLIFDTTNIISMYRILADLVSGKKDLNEIKGLIYFQTNNININLEKNPRWTWALDGEKYDNETREFQFDLSRNIDVLLPTESINKLKIKK